MWYLTWGNLQTQTPLTTFFVPRQIALTNINPTIYQKNFLVVGDIWLTNYQELINKLNLKELVNNQELIARLFQRYGIEAFKLLEGSFAFALWQQDSNHLFLVRDRTGSIPLYYTHQGDTYVTVHTPPK